MAPSDHTDSLQRIMNYCAYAERCTQDVIQKLTEWNVPEEEFENILQQLRNDTFLDDGRYAHSYVTDKWKLDVWGRGKIRNGLFQKGFGELQIQTALEMIDQEEYVSGMQNLLARKRDTIKSEQPVSQMKKMLSFGSSRGFEEELIWQWLDKEGLTFDADTSSSDEGDSF